MMELLDRARKLHHDLGDVIVNPDWRQEMLDTAAAVVVFLEKYQSLMESLVADCDDSD